MFQGVHETICFGPAATGWQEGEETINQIVFIGRDLDRKVRFACWVARMPQVPPALGAQRLHGLRCRVRSTWLR